jgi:hypothetical protein
MVYVIFAMTLYLLPPPGEQALVLQRVSAWPA